MERKTALDANSLKATLELQRACYLQHPVPDLAERKKDLLTLRRFLSENKDALCEVINADYGHRSRDETMLAEIIPALSGIDHILRHLGQWMKVQKRSVDASSFLGARNRVIPQPLGVVGVIVPWNFPVNLSFVPLSYIFAAGNRAMVKMSENSRHLAAFLMARIPAYFPPEKLQFFDETGGVGIMFSRLPLDHLLFTGSSQTGRAVMAAAATNLCPVTLELGGKSPAIVYMDFPLQTAVERIMFVKCLNAGQICTTVDYVWVPESELDRFVAMAKTVVAARYSDLNSQDYTSIIDQHSYDRLIHALDDAVAHGAQLVPLLDTPLFDPVLRKIAPHIVLNASDDCVLMQAEIFGPILPVQVYTSLDVVASKINAGPRPLALYPFSNDAHQIQSLIDKVMSGGVSVNDALFHVAQHDLPFGGVGASGMGQYHGKEGFETFSKMRPVFYQSRFNMLKFLMPPYGVLAKKILSYMSR